MPPNLTDPALDINFLTYKGPVRSVVLTLVAAAKAWTNDRAIRLGAALAYYSLFALVPVFFLAVSLAGVIFGQDVAGSTLEQSLADLIGVDLAGRLSAAIDTLRDESSNALLPVISLGVLLFTATALFVAWRDVVALIWDVPREGGVVAKLQRRLFGLAAVIGCGLLLALVIFAQMMIAALDNLIRPGALDFLVKISGSMVPGVLGAIFLMVLFRYTPNTTVAWRSVVLAAAVTMGMLTVGGWGYGIYLGTVGLTSATDLAGALLLGLALIYYSAQILLYGVEIAKIVHIQDTAKST